MYRNYNGYGRGQTNGRIAQLQHELQQTQAQAAAWQQEANRLEKETVQWKTAVSQQNKQIEKERALAQKKIQELKQQLSTLNNQPEASEDESNEWKEQYLQLSADYENTKKRVQQRYAQEADLEKEKLLRDMIPVADNLERALEHVTNQEEREGIELTLKAFTAVLEQNGVRKILAQDQAFDPNLHEAVSVTQAMGKPSGTIIAVTENGYTINEKLLRPARVIVTD